MLLSWATAAGAVLEAAGKSLHYKEITKLIIEQGLFPTKGETPSQTLNYTLNKEIREQGESSRFVRVRPGVFDLKTINHNSPAEIEELAAAQERAEAEGDFNPPESDKDAKKRQFRLIVLRQGQPEFRKNLLKAYNYRCAITGCNAQEALEAAHIRAYSETGNNHPSNGLLLRADLHILFDLNLISIEPETMTVHIVPKLRSTSYGELHGKCLQLPNDKAYLPKKEALKWQYNQCGK